MATTTVTYADGQKCPKCKNDGKVCWKCGRVNAQGTATITTNSSDLSEILLKLTDRSK